MRWILPGLIVLTLITVPAVGAQTPEAGRNQIITTGGGRIEVAPDQATITVGAQAQRPTAAEAIAEVNRVAAQAAERLRALGVRPDAIRTASVQVVPVYSTPRDGAAPQVTGYRAASMLTVTLNDLALVGRSIDAAIGVGANVVHGLTFGLRDPSRARNDALAMAVREAREKADAIAQAAGLRITGIERIVEEGATVAPRELRIAAAPMPTPIEPGLVSVTAQVSVVFRY